MKNKAYMLVLCLLVPTITSYSAWTDITISSDSQLRQDAQFVIVTLNGTAPDTPRVAIDGASIGTLFVNGTAELTMLAGRISGAFYSFDPENLDGDRLIRGPYSNSVCLNDTSIMIMSGGVIEGDITIAPGAQMHLYGYGFEYTTKEWRPSGGRPDEWWWKGGRLLGYWQNDQPVDLHFINDSFDRVILHQIPEPLTLLLMGFGAFFLHRRRY